MGSPKLQHKPELKKTVMIATLKISINGLYSRTHKTHTNQYFLKFCPIYVI
jgi:hypothetical protein